MTVSESLAVERFASNDEQIENPCIICLKDITPSNAPKIIEHIDAKGQSHQFHSECAHRWFQKNSNCPECRQRVTYVSFPEPLISNGTLFGAIAAVAIATAGFFLYRHRSNQQ